MKTNPWFRMYNDFIYDDKMEFLAFEDQRHFVFLLCMKNMGLLDKEYPKAGMLDRVVAKRLGLYGEAFDNAKLRLIDVGVIDEEWQPTAWNKRQFVSDADQSHAERQRRYRERKRQESNGDVTRDVTVTRLDTDTDTDTDTDKEEEKNKEAKKPAPATRIASVSAAELQELDVDSQVASEFLSIRKKKRAALTPLALAGIRREADAAGWTLDQALRKCVERGWQSFEAGWVADKQQSPQRQQTNADRNADWDARMNEVLAESLRPARQPMKDMGKIDAIN